MNITKISPADYTCCNNQIQSDYSRLSHTDTKLSFKSDSFSSSETPYERTARALRKTLDETIKKINNPNSAYGGEKSLYERQRENDELAQITKEFREINEALSKSSKANAADDGLIVLNYLEAMKNLGANEGFNRISGYIKVKDKLKSEFILDNMMMARTSQNKPVPNVLLFYGPTHNGKTTFAKALAEQSLSELCMIDPKDYTKSGGYDYCAIMNKISNEADIAKKRYQHNDKQRTIIVVNEAEVIAGTDSIVLSELKNFIKVCSKEYKCTLFLTTNYPLDIDSEILSGDVTPIKVAIDPPDRQICKEIVFDKLRAAKKHLPDNDINKIVDEFFKSGDKFYSNGDIVTNINEVWQNNTNPAVDDYIRMIRSGNIPPKITSKKINQFAQVKKELGQ